MASINKVILIGNLGRDPETRYSADGAAITNITIATSETWKDKATGEKKEMTEWHRVVFFNRLAEIAGSCGGKRRPSPSSQPRLTRVTTDSSAARLAPKAPPVRHSTIW